MSQNICWGLVLTGLLLSSCSQKLVFPASRLEIPEARGVAVDPTQAGAREERSRAWGRVHPLGTYGGNAVIPVESYSVEAPRTTDPLPLPSFIGYTAGGDLALSEKIDVSLRFGQSTPLMIRGKYQFLGEPETRASSGGFSAAVIAGAGYGVSGEGTSLPNSADLSLAAIDTSELMFDGEVLVGYRVSRRFLTYLGLSYSVMSISGTITHTTFGGKNTEFSLTGSGNTLSYLGGVQIDFADLYLRGELSYSSTTYDSLELSGIYGGLLLGARL